MRCLSVDFPTQFQAAFGKEGQVGFLKHRLHQQLDEFHPEDVINAYEAAIGERKGFMPGVGDIRSAASLLHVRRRNLEDQAWRARKAAEADSSLPDVDPVAGRKRLAEEMARLRETQASERQRMSDEDFASMRLQLTALKRSAEMAGDYVAMRVNNTPCSVSGCASSGNISPSISGGGPWYCARHFTSIAGG